MSTVGRGGDDVESVEGGGDEDGGGFSKEKRMEGEAVLVVVPDGSLLWNG